MGHILLASQLSQLVQEYMEFIPWEGTKIIFINIAQLAVCLLGLEIGEPSVAETLEGAVSNHCTKMLHVAHKGGQIRHLETFRLYLPPESSQKKDESPQKVAACPVLRLHCWHKCGRYPGGNIKRKA